MTVTRDWVDFVSLAFSGSLVAIGVFGVAYAIRTLKAIRHVHVLGYLRVSASKRQAGSVAAFQNFEEVWAALGRLYDDIVKLQESQRQTTAQLQQNAVQLAKVTERIDRLTEGHERVTSMLATLAGTVTQLASVVDSHERRLARMEGQ